MSEQESSIKRHRGELLRELFDLLLGYPDGVSIRTALRLLRNRAQVKDSKEAGLDDQVLLMAIGDCVGGRWLKRESGKKGRLSVTKRGQKAYERATDPEEFLRESYKCSRRRSANKTKKAQKSAEETTKQKKGNRGKSAVRPWDIQELQRRAELQGEKWIGFPCKSCGCRIDIHVEWQAPQAMCKECLATELREAHTEEYVAKSLSRSLPERGRAVSGGLPSLGKKRR